MQRLEDDAGIFKDFINISDPPRRTDIEIEPVSSAIKRQLYEEQKRLCNGCGTKMLILNLEIDHKIPKSRGGGGITMRTTNCYVAIAIVSKGTDPWNIYFVKLEQESEF